MTESQPTSGWSAGDCAQIRAGGLSPEEADEQLRIFRRGCDPIRLRRPCRIGDGIAAVSPGERAGLLAAYEEACRTRRLMKFVPASGAATRMFKSWYRALDGAGCPEASADGDFFADLPRYALFPDLAAAVAAKGEDLAALMARRDGPGILRFILTDEGLGYGRLPKALLKFHATPEGGRTALEEHLVEAALYARDAAGVARLHLTVSPEHEAALHQKLSAVVDGYARRWDAVFEVGFSTQDPATNTIAAAPELCPFRDEKGELVFRPGGHGALLANLNALEADIVFLKNIDNCVPDRLKPETVLWKKLLAGILVALQAEIFAHLRRIEQGGLSAQELERIAGFCRERLHFTGPADFRERPPAERQALLVDRLNRPLRVCGMVQNEGEPGGGPFWVEDGGIGSALQIVEAFQVDPDSPEQQAIWRAATHFNPVDLVCGIRDFRGRKFDLAGFVDPTKAAISRKSEKGRDLLALERPGLWNGSMAFWNTVFVEVPLSTFNPVKTVADLLRPQHLPG